MFYSHQKRKTVIGEPCSKEYIIGSDIGTIICYALQIHCGLKACPWYYINDLLAYNIEKMRFVKLNKDVFQSWFLE